jgi:hypothetical protein
MDKKVSKRSFKSPTYFNSKGKKGKRSLMFSAVSVPIFKGNHEDTFKKCNGNSCRPSHTNNNNFNDLLTNNKEIGEKAANIQISKDIKHSTFKINKD